MRPMKCAAGHQPRRRNNKKKTNQTRHASPLAKPSPPCKLICLNPTTPYYLENLGMKFSQTARLLLLTILACCFLGFAKRQPKVSVRFYTQATKSDSTNFAAKLKLLGSGQVIYVSKVPVISEDDIAGIYPYHAADGTMGCVFKLDRHGAIGLNTLSIENRGKILVALVDGRQVADLYIDRPIEDGIITIPSGILPQEIQQLAKKYPIAGKTKKKKH